VRSVLYQRKQAQEWKRYFAGQPDISNLMTLDQMQGIITLGS
jgi:hypothetical protein